MPAKGQKSKAQRTPKPKRICRVVGCQHEANKPGSARGLCLTHYGHWLRNGKTEIPVIPPPPPELPPISMPVRPHDYSWREFDMGLVERSAQIGCTNGEISSLLGVAGRTFTEHLAKDPELREFLERGREAGRAALRRMQWQGAEAGNATMLIWLGKQLLDQKDKLENSGTMETNTRLIVELVGEPAPAIEHELQPERFTPRLVNDVEWKG